MIYLDNNATTPIDPAALEAMLPFLREHFANASSGYSFSKTVKKALQKAREQVAGLLDCEAEEIVFTSGGTEADNAALFSATQAYPERKHLVTAATEHDAVLNYAKWLGETHGYEVTVLPVDTAGRICLTEFDKALRPGETAIASIMWGNNETGVLAPVLEAAEIAAAKGVLFHTDAVQAVGKVPISLRSAQVHYLALSGHKFHAPKGVGVLYVNRRVRFHPWMLGGGQEHHRRAGTENIASIVALGQAAEEAAKHLARHGNNDPIRQLRDFFEQELRRRLPDSEINGHPEHRTPNTTNVRLPGCTAEGMIILLDQKKICCSAGSACNTGALHPSHVLAAMGRSPEQARECLRFSFSRFTQKSEVETALDEIEAAAKKMRSLAS